jgi:hypothetical protein
MVLISKIPTIVKEGKLKTYDQGTSFLKVYYAQQIPTNYNTTRSLEQTIN